MDIDYNEKYNGYIGIDEAGRGCVGGELVFTGVKLKSNTNVDFADDSKKLTYNQRENMSNKILNNVEQCTVITTAKEIDEIGLSLAIKKSLETIISYFPNSKYLYDGNKVFGVDNPNLEILVKADALVKIVGAASILAKQTKDNLMFSHHKEFPMYNFASNSGYITKEHVSAIKEFGYCEYHRKSYRIKELEEWKNNQVTNILF